MSAEWKVVRIVETFDGSSSRFIPRPTLTAEETKIWGARFCAHALLHAMRTVKFGEAACEIGIAGAATDAPTLTEEVVAVRATRLLWARALAFKTFKGWLVQGWVEGLGLRRTAVRLLSVAFLFQAAVRERTFGRGVSGWATMGAEEQERQLWKAAHVAVRAAQGTLVASMRLLYLLVPVLLLVLAGETDKIDGLPDKLMMRR